MQHTNRFFERYGQPVDPRTVRVLECNDLPVERKTKNQVFLENFIFRTLPEVFPTSDSRQFALAHSNVYNIEHLTEIALSRASGEYDFVDGEGYDFTDYSDSKTTSINAKTRVVTVGSIENKIGALRICCFNPFRNSVDFFFVSKQQVSNVALPCYGKNSFKQRILARYNAEQDHYNQFEQYRVTDFETLAKQKG